MSVLAATLQKPAAPTMSAEDVDALIADIVKGRIATPRASGPRRRRQRRWIAGGIAFSVLAGGTTVAAVWRSHPRHPEDGIACHASSELHDAQTVIVSPTADPLAACGELWLAGVFPSGDDRMAAPGTTLPMFACVGPGGGFEVFPHFAGSAASCAELGLADAIDDINAEPSDQLHVRLTNDINLQCVDLDTARALVESALFELDLGDWMITTRGNFHGCVKAGEELETKSVYLFTVPTRTQP
jgi:hypothetical protein